MHRQLKSDAKTSEAAHAATGGASPMFRRFSARMIQNGTVLLGIIL
jgi:hypothetical protein